MEALENNGSCEIGRVMEALHDPNPFNEYQPGWCECGDPESVCQGSCQSWEVDEYGFDIEEPEVFHCCFDPRSKLPAGYCSCAEHAKFERRESLWYWRLFFRIRANYWQLKASIKRQLSIFIIGKKRTKEYEDELPF